MTTQIVNPFAEFLAENGPKTVTPLRPRHQSDRELFAVLRSQVENLIPTVNRMVQTETQTDALVDAVQNLVQVLDTVDPSRWIDEGDDD